MIPIETLKKRVQKGVRLLNRTNPNWYKHIDGGSITMEMPCQCVLGQLFGNYYSGVKILKLAKPSTVLPMFEREKLIKAGAPYGFSFSSFDSNRYYKTEEQEAKGFDQLGALWHKEIKKLWKKAGS